MKKLLLLLVTASLCLVFVACAESNPSPVNQDNDTDTTQETEADTEITEQPMEFISIGSGHSERPPRPEHEGVELVIDSITPSSVKFKFKNETDLEFTFGYHFRLFEKQYDTWGEMDIWTNRAIPQPAIFINPQSETWDTHERFFLYDPGWIEKPEKTTLDSGEYMFVVPYTHGGGQGVPPTGTYSARHVFTIE
ncbi:MAG: hypothetical protein FWG45_03905 [Oscillospiraceae bacterium]|nr:hypothetical protein [Oscillospiraceae bacterium]